MDDREAVRKAGDVARKAKARRKAEGKRTDPGVNTPRGDGNGYGDGDGDGGGGGGCVVAAFAVIGAVASWKGWT